MADPDPDRDTDPRDGESLIDRLMRADSSPARGRDLALDATIAALEAEMNAQMLDAAFKRAEAHVAAEGEILASALRDRDAGALPPHPWDSWDPIVKAHQARLATAELALTTTRLAMARAARAADRKLPDDAL